MRIGLICALTAAFPLGGCLSLQQEANLRASQRQIVCIDEVEYIAVPVKDGWAMAAHYKPNGSLYTCTDSVPRS